MTATRMPVLFVGHGNPMNAIEDNLFSRVWTEEGRNLPQPRAIVCISAHWQTDGTSVTAMENPETIHDFYGFPQALYDMTYPAPGDPDLAERLMRHITLAKVYPNRSWGLDHGTWSVLCRMFPNADIPVVQLSLDENAPASFHYDLGQELRPLRDEGILFVGSGNIVHNLHVMKWGDSAFDWALESDATMASLIEQGRHEALVNYEKLPHSRLAIPTNEHYLPLLYVLGMMDNEPLRFFNAQVTLGSISMRSLRIG